MTRVDRNVSVAMRDGTELATDVYRPDETGTSPALVLRTPYGKHFGPVASTVLNPVTAPERGYAMVVQDTRGRFESDGTFVPFLTEVDDGYDTVEWAADQPWCDGNVGIFGNSYNGATARLAALADPPHLEAVVGYLTGSNYYQGWAYTGGALELGFIHRWAVHLGLSSSHEYLEEDEREAALAALAEGATDLERSMSHLPLSDAPTAPDPAIDYYHEWLDHPSYDEFWERLDATKHVDSISAPTLDIAGWQDIFLKGSLDMYRAVMSDGDQAIREGHRMIIGPWAHDTYMGFANHRSGDKAFGPNASTGAPFVTETIYSFFDAHLKGASQRLDEIPEVRYYDAGAREWNDDDSWPPAGRKERIYLHSGGQANSRFGDGALYQQAPEDQPPDSFDYDPLDPVPTKGGHILMPELQEAGYKDQSAIEERDDVLVYTSPRLTEPVRIAGPAEVTLYAASSAPDTDFTAKLVDVEPDGTCTSLLEGTIRARYRDSFAEPEFMDPGSVYEFTIDLWDIAHTFDSGHRLRLEISSSNFPRFDRNPNAEMPVSEAGIDDMVIASQNVYHDEDRPSHVSLSVVDGSFAA